MSVVPRSISNGDFKTSSGNTPIVSFTTTTSSTTTPTIKISNPTMVSGNSSLTSGNGVISVGPTVHIANPEEDNMNLAQLLACFPDPPTFSHVTKQRKDTIYSFVSPPQLQGKQSVFPDQKLNQNTDQLLSSPDKIIINENNKLERSHSVSQPDNMSDAGSSSSSFSPINLNRDDLSSTNDSIDIDMNNSINTKVEVIQISNSPIIQPNTNNTITINNISPIIQSQPNSNINSNTNSPILNNNNNNNNNLNVSNNNNHHQSTIIPNNNNNQNNYNVSSNNNRVTVSFGNFPKSNSSPLMSSVGSYYQTPKWDINLNQLQPQQATSAGNLGSPVESVSPALSSQQNPPNYELYYRACKNDLLPIEFNRVLYSILESKLTDILPILDRCFNDLPNSSKDSISSNSNNNSSSNESGSSNSSSKKSNFKASFLTAVKSVVGDDTAYAKLPKIVLFFGAQDRAVPVNQEFTDELIIQNQSSSKKLRFKLNLGAISKDFTVNVSQKEGTINKKSSMSISISVNLKTTLKLRKIITVELENGYKYFVILQIESGKTAFGQLIENEELIDDDGYKIPKTLFTLKKFFVENGGLTSESIFRSPPTSNQELYQVKEQISSIDKDPVIKCDDINVIATLIKMYFRELPQCLLNGISHQTFLSNDFDSDETLLLVNQISDIKRATFLWLIDLLTDVTKNESLNKMGPKSLAIIFAPNLYVTPTNCSPEDSIAVSGKVINFLLQMMNLIKNMDS